MTLRQDLQNLSNELQIIIAGLPPDSKVPLSYNARIDRIPAPKPQVPILGSAGYIFKDPTFGTQIVRVTDANSAPALGTPSFRTPSNLQRRAWSADGNSFYLTTTSGSLVSFNFNPDMIVAKPSVLIPLNDEPDFHPTQPGLLIGPITTDTALQIASYDLNRNLRTNLLDVTTVTSINLLSPRTYVRNVGIDQLGVRMMAVFGGTGQDRDYLILVTMPSGTYILNTVAGLLNGQSLPLAGASWGWHIHGAWFDKTGRYMFIQGTGAESIKGGTILWDIDGETAQLLSPLPGGHMSVGYGMSINQDAGSPWDAAQFQLRNLSQPDVVTALINPVLTPEEIYLDNHTSWHNCQPDNLAPVIAGFYRYTFDGGPNPPLSIWRAWDDEIVAIKTSSPADVWRFCHHRTNTIYASSAGNDPTKPRSFWASPRPQVSPDGRFILFTSNWEQTLGVDLKGNPGEYYRQDVFLAKIA